jgi:GDP-L-fucose synthase
LAETIKEVVGYKGSIYFDTTKPDGVTRKLLDSSRINSLSFKPEFNLKEGLIRTYKEYMIT